MSENALEQKVALLRGWKRLEGDFGPLWLDPGGHHLYDAPPEIGWPLAGELLEEIAAAGHPVELYLSRGFVRCHIFGSHAPSDVVESHPRGTNAEFVDLPQAIAEAWIQWKENQDG